MTSSQFSWLTTILFCKPVLCKWNCTLYGLDCHPDCMNRRKTLNPTKSIKKTKNINITEATPIHVMKHELVWSAASLKACWSYNESLLRKTKTELSCMVLKSVCLWFVITKFTDNPDAIVSSEWWLNHILHPPLSDTRHTHTYKIPKEVTTNK